MISIRGAADANWPVTCATSSFGRNNSPFFWKNSLSSSERTESKCALSGVSFSTSLVLAALANSAKAPPPRPGSFVLLEGGFERVVALRQSRSGEINVFDVVLILKCRAVVEAPSPEFRQRREYQARRETDTDKAHFDSVRSLDDSEFFQKNGLLFLPKEEVAQVTGQFASAAPLIEIMAGDPTLRGLTGALETGLAGVKRGEIKLDSTATPFSLIAQTVENVLKTGSGTFSWRELANGKPLTDADRRSFIEFRPILDFNALEPGKDATDAIRKAASDLNLSGEYRARVRLTGPVPTANEEFATVQDGAVVKQHRHILVVLFDSLDGAAFVEDYLRRFRDAVYRPVNHHRRRPDDGGSLNLLSIRIRRALHRIGCRFRHPIQREVSVERFKNDDLEAACFTLPSARPFRCHWRRWQRRPDSCRSCRPTTRASPNSARSPVSVCWWRLWRASRCSLRC